MSKPNTILKTLAAGAIAALAFIPAHADADDWSGKPQTRDGTGPAVSWSQKPS